MVLAGRRINDGMGAWVVEQLVLELAKRKVVIGGSRVLVLGLSFKKNCTDLRNTRVVDLIEALGRYGMEAVVVDPWVDKQEAQREYGLEVLTQVPAGGDTYPAVIAAVAHRQFTALISEQWQQLLHPNGLLLDLKGILPRQLEAIRL